MFELLGVPDYMLPYREMVRQNSTDTKLIRQDYLIGIEFDANGKYKQKLYIKNSYINIASFIARNDNYKILLTSNDLCVITTVNNFLDLCSDKEYTEELVKAIRPLQKRRVYPELELVF